jgi:ABC-type bacteriocin/lantibiotic exporter with double-glycine peptidase domain
MIESIKASGAENGYFEKWSGYQAGEFAQRIKLSKLNRSLGTLPALVSSLFNISILIAGVFLIMRGRFTAGMIMAFQGFMSSFSAPAEKLIAGGQAVQEMRTDMERIEDVMEYPADAAFSEEAGEEFYGKLTGEIELKDVSFGYSPLGKPLIEGFSLKINPGGKVAFVGSSGCGKSTLSKLISGLYQPWDGEILFDGKPMKDIPRPAFKGSLAVIDQDTILFEDAIAANIKMWDDSIEDYEMIMAAKDARLHDDVMKRADGYQYKIMEGGKDFSGGQRQRFEIARVLAQDPTIVVMDEATSALDAKTEREVVDAIKKRGVTCIVIAHRLSTIRDCDEIIVMDKGKIIERGSHEELYARGGLYARLISAE